MKETVTKDGLLLAAEELGGIIVESEQYELNRAARKIFLNDSTAQKLYNDFVILQREYQMAQQYNADSENENVKLIELQKQLLQNSSFKNYLEAQNELIDYLKEINLEISKELPFDFASLAKPSSGGCCG